MLPCISPSAITQRIAYCIIGDVFVTIACQQVAPFRVGIPVRNGFQGGIQLGIEEIVLCAAQNIAGVIILPNPDIAKLIGFGTNELILGIVLIKVIVSSVVTVIGNIPVTVIGIGIPIITADLTGSRTRFFACGVGGGTALDNGITVFDFTGF